MTSEWIEGRVENGRLIQGRVERSFKNGNLVVIAHYAVVDGGTRLDPIPHVRCRVLAGRYEVVAHPFGGQDR